MEKETETQIQQLQMFEQNLQSLLMQKQAFEMELTETENAMTELDKAEGEVYKIAGSLMIKGSKQEILKDLNQKKDLLSLRLKTINDQEKKISEETEKLREKVLSKIKNQK
ncbi:prefoldin subunit beta [Candidatus Pacearchaeota archaeon]|nr:prefoldin subunit beta [Candidatus Pacearchaeota archaeon]